MRRPNSDWIFTIPSGFRSRERASSHEVIPAENRRILRGKIIFRRLPFTSSGSLRTVEVHITPREIGERKRDGEEERGSIQSARRVRRSITTAIACLCSSPAISHLAGEPDPALLVPTDNWTNHSHSLRANYSPYLPSSSSSLSLFLCFSPVSLVDVFSVYFLFESTLSRFACLPLHFCILSLATTSRLPIYVACLYIFLLGLPNFLLFCKFLVICEIHILFTFNIQTLLI